jgi:hypothetical protein
VVLNYPIVQSRFWKLEAMATVPYDRDCCVYVFVSAVYELWRIYRLWNQRFWILTATEKLIAGSSKQR